jgi:hypothetical protein
LSGKPNEDVDPDLFTGKTGTFEIIYRFFELTFRDFMIQITVLLHV